ncbi:MAG: hypothetical protein O9267_00905 [Flavobacterium sp.]|uniref:hypothetical protein n=1 Tax=Flavobacterium sp. TaxID=239 RepID=UPI0022C8ADBA|nr:hypothetical protein [Flavobacterium sp.]MCZ8196147.1 hypothetical protein [Flavobacterium sp.]
MYNRPPILLDLLHICELIAFIGGLYQYTKIKKTYWIFFALYLMYITILEVFGAQIFSHFKLNTQIYLSYITVPIEFLFFIWLFALKSLKSEKIYIICTLLYLLSFIPDFSVEKGKYFFNSFNYLIGGFILLYLILLELNKQIKSEDILLFKQDKMFYITIGVALFYVGNLPFFGLYFLIMKEPSIWNSYYIYFMVSNCIMYLLFAASFIWGKPKS